MNPPNDPPVRVISYARTATRNTRRATCQTATALAATAQHLKLGHQLPPAGRYLGRHAAETAIATIRAAPTLSVATACDDARSVTGLNRVLRLITTGTVDIVAVADLHALEDLTGPTIGVAAHLLDATAQHDVKLLNATGLR